MDLSGDPVTHQVAPNWWLGGLNWFLRAKGIPLTPHHPTRPPIEPSNPNIFPSTNPNPIQPPQAKAIPKKQNSIGKKAGHRSKPIHGFRQRLGFRCRNVRRSASSTRRSCGRFWPPWSQLCWANWSCGASTPCGASPSRRTRREVSKMTVATGPGKVRGKTTRACRRKKPTSWMKGLN